MKQSKRRIMSWVLLFALAAAFVMPDGAVRAQAEGFDGYVYLMVEKTTLGQGLIVEPVKVGYHDGETICDALENVLGKDRLDIQESSYGGVYLNGIKDGGSPKDWNKEKVPSVITQAVEESADITWSGTRANEEWLAAVDYTSWGGWMVSVNNSQTDSEGNYISMSSPLSQNAVIRIQFSLTGGTDIESSSYGTPLYLFADKLELIKTVADYAGNKNVDAYKQANLVLGDWAAEEEAVTAAKSSLESVPDIADYSELSRTYPEKLCSVMDYLHQNTEAAFGAEWTVLGLARNDVTDVKWYREYYDSVVDTVKEQGSAAFSASKSTDNSRVVIALTAIGADAANIAGYNLTEPLSDYEFVGKQGLNGYIYALLALDCGGYEIPSAEEGKEAATREKLIDGILNRKLTGGGWTFSGNAADPDMTAMVLQALAPYYEEEKVKLAVDEALSVLSDMQADNGGFASWGVESAESCAQVVCALSALGLDADMEEGFVKNGNSALDAMLAYYDEETGGFKHTLTGKINGAASMQAAYALVAYDRFKNGKNGLYEMSDAACMYLCKSHSWDKGTVTKNPSVETEGEKVFVCTVCGQTKTEAVPKLTGAPDKKEETTEDPTGDELQKPSKPTIKQVTSPKKKQIKVTWKKKANVTGYELQISTSSRFAKAKTKAYKIKKAKAVSRTVKSLKSKRKYYVRLRSYRTVVKNGKTITKYSAWTGKKSVRVK